MLRVHSTLLQEALLEAQRSSSSVTHPESPLTTVILSPNLSRLRDLIVEDVLDVLDIETSGSYIRG